METMRVTLIRVHLLLMASSELCMGFAPDTHAACHLGGSMVRINAKKYNDDPGFDEYFAEQIASDVEGNLHVPFMIPSPVVTYMVEQTVTRMSTDLSKDTKLKLQELVEAASTPSDHDDFIQDEIDELAHRITKEINEKIESWTKNRNTYFYNKSCALFCNPRPSPVEPNG